MNPGAKYVVVPLGLNQYTASAGSPPARFAVAFHSAKPLLIDRRQIDLEAYAKALVQHAQQRGSRNSVFDYMDLYTVAQDAGYTTVAVNADPMGASFEVELDCSESANLVSSREAMIVRDTIPPMHAMVLIVLSALERGGYRWSARQKFRRVPYGNAAHHAHHPPVAPSTIHAVLPLPGANVSDSGAGAGVGATYALAQQWLSQFLSPGPNAASRGGW